jgi:uncharacterized protein (TIGR00255 family)
MIRSMTGYGAAEVATEAGRLSAEIRSVNHRYCEISLRLPRSITGLEGPVRQLLTERLSRGKINLTVSWDGFEEEGGRLRVNHDVARQVVAAMVELKTKSGPGKRSLLQSFRQNPQARPIPAENLEP